MDENLDDLVAAASLETEIFPEYIKHRFHDGASTSSTKEEIWDIRTEIGRGASGVVRKEELRIDRPQEPQLRAEFRPLLQSAAVFTGLALVAAASFAGSLRQLHWRRWAIAALWAGLIIVTWWYWPRIV